MSFPPPELDLATKIPHAKMLRAVELLGTRVAPLDRGGIFASELTSCRLK
jgi:hypothetical protein